MSLRHSVWLMIMGVLAALSMLAEINGRAELQWVLLIPAALMAIIDSTYDRAFR